MTALLPPNLLKLFAPRPQPHFLKPLSKDERQRGPDRLVGCAHLAQRIHEEAEDAEVKQGMGDQPATIPEANGDGEKGEVKDEAMGIVEEGEEAQAEGKKKKKKGDKPKVPKKDKIAELGVVGQEARKMRREARKIRQEEYKKNAEKNCEIDLTPLGFLDARLTDCLSEDRPQDDENASGDPYKTLFISRLVSLHIT